VSSQLKETVAAVEGVTPVMSSQPNPVRGPNAASRFQETLLPGGMATPGVPNRILSSGVALPNLPLVVGDFVIQEVLARGGMSLTFLGIVRDEPNRKVVVKVPLREDADTVERLQNEIGVLRELQHPGIVRVVGSGVASFPFGEGGVASTRPWLAMEYISGESLRQRLGARGRLGWVEVRKLLDDIVEVLDYLASHRVCHRDIKPDNLIYDPGRGRWVLVDFGIAKSLDSNLRLTLTLAGHDP